MVWNLNVVHPQRVSLVETIAVLTFSTSDGVLK